MAKKLRLAVVGSRNFTGVAAFALLAAHLDRIQASAKGLELVIVSGGADGADSLAENWAHSRGCYVDIYKPDWKTHGRSAGFKRNTTIWANADAGIAFWDGESKGTQHSFGIAKRMGKPLTIVLTHDQMIGGTQRQCPDCKSWVHHSEYSEVFGKCDRCWDRESEM